MTDIPTPYYQKHVFVCCNRREDGQTSCAAAGAEALLAAMKKRVGELKLVGVRVNKSGCLGRCAEGPCVVVYPEGAWYAPKTEQDGQAIIDSLSGESEAPATLRI